MTIELEATEIVTEPCVLAFPHLFEPYQVSKTKKEIKKWQCAIIIPDEVDLKPFYDCMKAALIEKFDKVPKLKTPSPIKDCEEKEHLAGYDNGGHYMNVKSGYPITVVDQRGRPLTDPEKIFAGCWCRFHLKCYAWNHEEGGKGVSFSIEGVQLVRTGERLDGGGGARSTDVFEPLEIEDEDDMLFDDDDEDGDYDDASELFG